MKLEKDLNRVIASAFYEAKQERHEYVTPEHLLYSALHSEQGRDIISSLGGDIEMLRAELKKHMKKHIPIVKTGSVMQSRSFQELMNIAATRAASAGKKHVHLTDMLVAFYDCEECFATWFLLNQGIERYEMVEYVSHGFIADSGSEPDEEGFFHIGETSIPKKLKKKKKENIEDFTENLNKMASADKLDPLIGREKILSRTMQILCRKNKHNPVHVGEAGVGKTAITEGLAQRVVSGDVPEPLKNAVIFRMNMGAMLAGTKYRGEFEKRMKTVLSQLSKHDNAVLFIDEIHTIVGAGAVSGGSLDASNILKPFLTSSNMKCIGATTYDEYHKHFEKDSALTRRFQKIDIPETTELQTFDILDGLKERYQNFHRVKYTEEALRAACRLSKQYITGRYLPDKAIDVIDEAGARNSMLKNRKKLLRERDIERVVSGMTKIPEKNISRDESKKLKYLHNSILKNLFGQDHAVQAVVDSIKRQRAGFSNPEKPVASFLFVGPTGVGKTELAKLMSHEMGIALHRFDMSEYQEKHAVAKFIGSPPGYVGYEQGGQLTESIRKEPNAVLLLDEIEKAHEDIFNTLLQIMDYATLTDNNGKKADFRNVIIIMTSNAGAREMGKAQLGFGDRELNMGELDRAVDRIFSPEFRNRVEKIVKFNMLQQNQINRIAKKHLDEFALKLENRGIKLDATPAVYSLIGEKGFSEIFGAREIHRTVKNMVEDPLVDDVLFGKLKKGGTIKLYVRKGEIRFNLEEK